MSFINYWCKIILQIVISVIAVISMKMSGAPNSLDYSLKRPLWFWKVSIFSLG